MYAYEQALLALGFYPNVWYQAALYLEDRSKQLFERGVCLFHRKYVIIVNMYSRCFNNGPILFAILVTVLYRICKLEPKTRVLYLMQ